MSSAVTNSYSRSDLMQEFLGKPPARVSALACILFLATGCGSQRSEKDYLPAESKARTALDNALSAWQHGQSVGEIAGAGGTVQVVDSDWKAGRKLAEYQILQAEPGSGPPRFAVKLQLQG